MGIFVKHEPCPKCGSRDNLARYADGSAWCFGCGEKQRADRIVDQRWLEKKDDTVQLDDDLCFDYPRHVVGWLGKYGITVEEAIKHGWKYGPKRDQLVFIYKDAEGNVSLTQARNFRAGAKKYFNTGSAEATLPIFRVHDRGDNTGLLGVVSLTIVEDALSAARIARQIDAMPLLGSYLPKAKMKALRLLGYEQLAFWLDENKLKESRAMADTAKWLGFETRVIYTELDPKEYSDKEITEWLQ